MQVLLRNDTLQAFIALLNFGVERGGSIMRLTVYTECRFRVNLLCFEKEGILDSTLADVTFHEDASFLFLLRIDQILNYVEC